MEITPDIYVKLQHIEDQIGRLISDAESEKEVRKDRNAIIDRRLKILEDDKIKKDIIVWLFFFVGSAAGSVITILIEKFLK